MHYTINPTSKLKGTLRIPASKSHTLRAILFASLATGKSIIHNYLASPDTHAMIKACELLGAKITIEDESIILIGTAGKPHTPDDIIDVGNSGLVLRFIAAVSALTNGTTVLTGDQSIRSNRPMQPLLDGLNQLKVSAISTKNDGHAPIIIKGPLVPGTTTLAGEDSQPVSALLIACAFAESESKIFVENPGEKPWIDLTFSWFDRLRIQYHRKGYSEYQVAGRAHYPGFEYTVPGDFSSAAFPLVAALITQSELKLNLIDMKDVQGDKAIIPLLEKMGARFEIGDNFIIVKKSPTLKGMSIDANDFIDAVPILAVLACFASGETRITNAAIARKKESDRLSAITLELTKMGAIISEVEDGLIIQNSPLKGTHVDSHKDHRIALALSVAALGATGETRVNDTDCVAKTYPGFIETILAL